MLCVLGRLLRLTASVFLSECIGELRCMQSARSAADGVAGSRKEVVPKAEAGNESMPGATGPYADDGTDVAVSTLDGSRTSSFGVAGRRALSISALIPGCREPMSTGGGSMNWWRARNAPRITGRVSIARSIMGQWHGVVRAPVCPPNGQRVSCGRRVRPSTNGWLPLKSSARQLHALVRCRSCHRNRPSRGAYTRTVGGLTERRPEWRARPFHFGGANIHGGDSEGGPPRGALRPRAAGTFRVHHQQQ